MHKLNLSSADSTVRDGVAIAQAGSGPGCETHTPGPWSWVIEDHSMASLGVLPDPGLGDPLVLVVSPCRSCVKHAENDAKRDGQEPEWKWGRCHTPSLADATLLAAAPDLYDALRDLYDSTADYIRINKLGDANSTHAMRRAAAALAKASGVSVQPSERDSGTDAHTSANKIED